MPFLNRWEAGINTLRGRPRRRRHDDDSFRHGDSGSSLTPGPGSAGQTPRGRWPEAVGNTSTADASGSAASAASLAATGRSDGTRAHVNQRFAEAARRGRDGRRDRGHAKPQSHGPRSHRCRAPEPSRHREPGHVPCHRLHATTRGGGESHPSPLQ